MVRYEFGSVCFQHGGTKRYITFADSFIANLASCWRTKSFTVANPFDTLSFARFASFDDQNELSATFTDTTLSTAHPEFEAFFEAFYTRYVQNDFYVFPSSAAFPDTSQILYIVELHNASDSSLIARLDTVACVLGDSGQCLWWAVGDGQLRKISLGFVSPNTSVYLEVKRVAPGISFIADMLTMEAHNVAFQHERHMAHQIWQPNPAYKQSSYHNAAISTQVRLLSNNVFYISAQNAGAGLLEFFDEQGRVVFKEGFELKLGENTVKSSFSANSTGSYFLRFSQNQNPIGSLKIIYENGQTKAVENMSSAMRVSARRQVARQSMKKSFGKSKPLGLGTLHKVKGYSSAAGDYQSGSPDWSKGNPSTGGHSTVTGMDFGTYEPTVTQDGGSNPIPGYSDTGHQIHISFGNLNDTPPFEPPPDVDTSNWG